jgi:adenosylmethionine-8-amino-7-oxononanoate aminotransferase
MRDKTSKAPYPPAHRLSAGVAQHAAARGLAVYPMQGSVDGYSGDHLLIAPPAVLSQEQAQWAVENLRGAIQSAIQD